ncbi:hypothetical protein [uncultured Microscilla sp.]|uniref:hypothetical protein n=1 Tax=uncultured Microscilla sp. TaxID=432653 RepID=UPI002601C708|nr:hypothetical protein [uncultured Microscilla sp.]
MKNLLDKLLLMVLGLALSPLQGCQPSAQHNFIMAKDTCFRNSLPINPTIKYGMATGQDNFQYPHIYKSLLHMPGVNIIKDSMAFLSRDKEIRITHWKASSAEGRHKKLMKEVLTYNDLAKFNDYVATQKMFIADSSMQIKSNVMYKNCKHPHFIMQGATKTHHYFMKTELSGLPLIKNKVLKNCLIRFPKKLKTKYWGTVHQMLAKTGYIQTDTVKLKQNLAEVALEEAFYKYIEEEGANLPFSFTVSMDACFKNKIKPHQGIKYHSVFDTLYAYRVPVINNSSPKTYANKQLSDYQMFSSPDSKVLVTAWHGHAVLTDQKDRKGYINTAPWTHTYLGLKVFNNMAIGHQVFSNDKTVKVVKNVMYEKCNNPHFIMQGENEQHIYLLKSELSNVPIVGKPVIKTYLIRLAKDATDKYWNTAHQMLQEFGYDAPKKVQD